MPRGGLTAKQKNEYWEKYGDHWNENGGIRATRSIFTGKVNGYFTEGDEGASARAEIEAAKAKADAKIPKAVVVKKHLDASDMPKEARDSIYIHNIIDKAGKDDKLLDLGGYGYLTKTSDVNKLKANLNKALMSIGYVEPAVGKDRAKELNELMAGAYHIHKNAPELRNNPEGKAKFLNDALVKLISTGNAWDASKVLDEVEKKVAAYSGVAPKSKAKETEHPSTNVFMETLKEANLDKDYNARRKSDVNKNPDAKTLILSYTEGKEEIGLYTQRLNGNDTVFLHRTGEINSRVVLPKDTKVDVLREFAAYKKSPDMEYSDLVKRAENIVAANKFEINKYFDRDNIDKASGFIEKKEDEKDKGSKQKSYRKPIAEEKEVQKEERVKMDKSKPQVKDVYRELTSIRLPDDSYVYSNMEPTSYGNLLTKYNDTTSVKAIRAAIIEAAEKGGEISPEENKELISAIKGYYDCRMFVDADEEQYKDSLRHGKSEHYGRVLRYLGVENPDAFVALSDVTEEKYKKIIEKLSDDIVYSKKDTKEIGLNEEEKSTFLAELRAVVLQSPTKIIGKNQLASILGIEASALPGNFDRKQVVIELQEAAREKGTLTNETVDKILEKHGVKNTVSLDAQKDNLAARIAALTPEQKASMADYDSSKKVAGKAIIVAQDDSELAGKAALAPKEAPKAMIVADVEKYGNVDLAEKIADAGNRVLAGSKGSQNYENVEAVIAGLSDSKTMEEFTRASKLLDTLSPNKADELDKADIAKAFADIKAGQEAESVAANLVGEKPEATIAKN